MIFVFRASVDSSASQGNGPSTYNSVSGTGRYVAFQSNANNLVTGDTNNQTDVFVYDLYKQSTKRVNLSTAGDQAVGGFSRFPIISNNGEFVAFQSTATNLVANDTNNRRDIFLRNLTTGETKRVSVSSTGTQATNNSGDNVNTPGISGDGGFVAFQSFATNLVSGDTNGIADLFLRDVTNNTTTRISLGFDGTQADGASGNSSLSNNGNYIAYVSNATNLVDNDTNDLQDIFLYDKSSGTTTRVSVSNDPSNPDSNDNSDNPSISGDGRYIAFQSDASNLVANDDNQETDIFVYDRTLGTTTLVNIPSDSSLTANGSSFNPSISNNGRYVTFSSDASNLVTGDTNGTTDIFVRDLQTGTTKRVSVSANGTQPGDGTQISGTSLRPSINNDGRYVSFDSSASNVVTGDTNGVSDVFVYDEGIVGTENNDTLTGTEASEVIEGLGGNDGITSWGGDDTVYGGSGNDYINGVHGSDLLFGEDGDDYLMGNVAEDTLNGGNGLDVLNGAAGNDSLSAGADRDFLLASDGNDTLDGGSGNDFFQPSFSGLAGERDILTGGEGNDVFRMCQDGVKNYYDNDGNAGYGVITDMTASDRIAFLKNVSYTINKTQNYAGTSALDTAFFTQAGDLLVVVQDNTTLINSMTSPLIWFF